MAPLVNSLCLKYAVEFAWLTGAVENHRRAPLPPLARKSFLYCRSPPPTPSPPSVAQASPEVLLLQRVWRHLVDSTALDATLAISPLLRFLRAALLPLEEARPDALKPPAADPQLFSDFAALWRNTLSYKGIRNVRGLPTPPRPSSSSRPETPAHQPAGVGARRATAGRTHRPLAPAGARQHRGAAHERGGEVHLQPRHRQALAQARRARGRRGTARAALRCAGRALVHPLRATPHRPPPPRHWRARLRARSRLTRASVRRGAQRTPGRRARRSRRRGSRSSATR